MKKALTLEDMPVSVKLPNLYSPLRLDIDHQSGEWKLDDEHFPGSIRAVMLGLVRQRIFWEMGTVICRSYDFRTGHAVVNQYPWGDTDFEPPPSYEPAIPKSRSFFGTTAELATPGTKAILECEKCPLHHWSSRDPLTGKQQPPRCREQFVVPMLVAHAGEWVVSYASFQKSSLKPARDYMTKFRDQKESLYTVITRMKLVQNLGSNFRYSVPEFKRSTETPEMLRPVMSLAFRTMRDRMQQPVTQPVPSRSFFG